MITLNEIWSSPGRSNADRAKAAVRGAAELAEETHGDDKAIPIFLAAAQTFALLEIADELAALRRQHVA